MKKRNLITMVAMFMVVILTMSGCSGKKFATVTDYINNEEVKASLDEMIASMGEGLDVTVDSEDATLIIVFTMPEGIDTSSAPDVLKSGMEEQGTAVVGFANEIQKLVKQDTITIRYIYNNADGTELYTHEFVSDAK